ncbi:MAG: FHA domain-containing protein [Pontiella sp.]
MSHLIIEQGTEVGKEIAVPAGGMKFGRSPANDLVLADDRVMLFQGRFFFKSDGSLWVTDFSAAEKTTVGGEPIDEYALKVGDLVEVGPTAFRVIATTLAGDTPASKPTTDVAVDEDIDLGFKASKKTQSHKEKKERTKTQSLVHRILQVLVILLVLLVIAIAAPELMRIKGTEVAPVVEQEKSLSFRYEFVRGSYKDIFRYYLELAPDGKVSIMIDNLGRRHINKSVDVSAEVLDTLSRRLKGSGFFEIDRDYVIRAPNAYESYNIAIYCNGRFNHVRVLNKEKPKDFEHTVSILEDFVFSQLDVPFTLLEDEDTLLRYAAESFKLGEESYSERDVRPGNLALAVKHYREAVVYLETLEPKPELYDRTKRGMERAASEQDTRYKEYKFNAERAMRLGDWREAEKQLRVLAELIPDRNDDRHETISSKQLEVEEHLR